MLEGDRRGQSFRLQKVVKARPDVLVPARLISPFLRFFASARSVLGIFSDFFMNPCSTVSCSTGVNMTRAIPSGIELRTSLNRSSIMPPWRHSV